MLMLITGHSRSDQEGRGDLEGGDLDGGDLLVRLVNRYLAGFIISMQAELSTKLTTL